MSRGRHSPRSLLGSGTTALTALKMGRRFIGVEINRDYCEMALRRIEPYLSQQRLVDFRGQTKVGLKEVHMHPLSLLWCDLFVINFKLLTLTSRITSNKR